LRLVSAANQLFHVIGNLRAEPILLDIHITKDDVLVMFHDPELGKKTTGQGKIHETPWAGVLE